MRLGQGTSQVARSLRPTGKAHPATGDQGQQTEPDEGLIQAFYRWREKCVNPENDRLRNLIEPQSN